MTNNDTAGWPRQDEVDRLTDALTAVRKDRDMWRQRAIGAGWTLSMDGNRDAVTAVLPAITPEVVELVRRECEKAVAARESGAVREVAIERTPYASVTRAVATALGDVRGELFATIQPGSAISTADAAVRKVATAWGVAL
jgi:hypothetical protein